MTDRTQELLGSHSAFSSPTHVEDIETGRDADTDASLAKFNREADAIDKVFVWANKSISTVEASLSDPDTLPSVTAQLDAIDTKLDAVRKRLKRIAAENKELTTSQSVSSTAMRIRVARYTKLGKDFMNIVTNLQKVREHHKSLTIKSVKRDVLRANPHVSESQVQRALDDHDPTQLDAIVNPNDPQLRHQLEDLQSRNRDIQNLTKNIVELHQMFTDMSILVEGQQELINDIEYNVKEVKADTRKAADELVVALDHQRSARKKKICICVLVTVILVIIVAAILILIGSQNGWFSSNNSSSNSSNNSSTNSVSITSRQSHSVLDPCSSSANHVFTPTGAFISKPSQAG